MNFRTNGKKKFVKKANYLGLKLDQRLTFRQQMHIIKVNDKLPKWLIISTDACIFWCIRL